MLVEKGQRLMLWEIPMAERQKGRSKKLFSFHL